MNLPPLNYTMLSDFWNCPRKCYHARIAKDLPSEEKSEAQLKGIAVHGAFEHFINAGIPSPLVEPHRAMVEPLLAHKPKAELKLGMTEALTPAKFFGQPFMRGVLDVFIMPDPRVVLLVDWKTGKVREDKRELECQAILVKANYPSVEKITGIYGWLVENRLGVAYDLSNVERPLAAIHATKAEMQRCADGEHWPENPNPLCGWCPVKQCKFNRSE
jgi:hypothetical protein